MFLRTWELRGPQFVHSTQLVHIRVWHLPSPSRTPRIFCRPLPCETEQHAFAEVFYSEPNFLLLAVHLHEEPGDEGSVGEHHAEEHFLGLVGRVGQSAADHCPSIPGLDPRLHLEAVHLRLRQFRSHLQHHHSLIILNVDPQALYSAMQVEFSSW